MQLEKIRDIVGSTLHMTYDRAIEVSENIIANNYCSILELGFCHGVSTLYMAAVLDELGEGHITAIDLVEAREYEPSINDLLKNTGLEKYMTIYFEPTSYIWRLMKMLEEETQPKFDFCYIDGAHNWFTDGFAFFLVDRLLKPGGMIIFDDIDWTYGSSPSLKNTEMVEKMPEDEKNTPQIRKVYELLVKPHPDYGDFKIKDDWAYATKISSGSSAASVQIKKEIVHEKEHIGLGAALLTILRKLKK